MNKVKVGGLIVGGVLISSGVYFLVKNNDDVFLYLDDKKDELKLKAKKHKKHLRHNSKKMKKNIEKELDSFETD